MLLIRILLICKILIVAHSADNNNSQTDTTITPDENEKAVDVSNRIIGGESTNIKTYPFVVSIQWRLGSRHHCGGSYILPKYVLSAAHCMVRYDGKYWKPENPRFYLVLAGTSNLWYSPTWQLSTTEAVLPHPYFHYGVMSHDIGLYKISKPFRLTPYVNYAPLPAAYDEKLFKKNQSSCTVVGWGKTSIHSTVTSDSLQSAKLPLIPTKECSKFFTHPLHASQICAGLDAGGIDACQGDSGGPLVCNDTLIGIVSWGHGCALPKSPGVYCRVDKYIKWIQTAAKSAARSNINPIILSSFGQIFLFIYMFCYIHF